MTARSSLAAWALSAALSAAVTAAGGGLSATEAHVAGQGDRPEGCTRHYQRDATIYFHNNCSFNVWWAACVTFGWGDGEERQGDGLGVPPGEFGSFSPGPGPFTYRILQTARTDETLDCFN